MSVGKNGSEGKEERERGVDTEGRHIYRSIEQRQVHCFFLYQYFLIGAMREKKT